MINLRSIDNIVNIREYLIEDETNELDFSKVNILVKSIKANGLEDTKNRYPNMKINITDLNETPFRSLPDIYQSNLNILDQR